MGNKEREQDCLNRLFSLEKQTYGKVRKFINKLSNMNRYDFERPDFVFNDNAGNYIGLEHFMVDHLSQLNKNGKIASNGALPRENISNSLPEYVGDNAPTNDNERLLALGKLGKLLDDYLTKSIGTTFGNYIAAFDYSLSNHLKNVDIYRENIKEKFNAKSNKIKIGLLIEVYAEFGNLYLVDKKGAHKNSHGFLPMFDTIVTLLEDRLKDKVDFIIFLHNKKIFIMRPGHIKNDLEFQKVKVYEYVAHDYALPSFTPFRKDLKISSNVTKEMNSYNFLFNVSFNPLNEKYLKRLIFYSFYRAAKAKKDGKNLACSLPVLLLLEVFLKYVVDWQVKEEKEGKFVIPIFSITSKELLKKEIEEFNTRWEIEDSLI